MCSAWGHVTHPCQRGLRVWEVTSGQERYGPQTNQLQRAGYQGVPGTLSLFLREPGPLHAILGALKRVRERKSMYMPCRLLGRLLESGCEGNLCPPHWFRGLSQGFATCHVGARMPSGPRGGRGGPRSRSMGSDSATRELRTHCWGHSDEQDKQSLVVELLVLAVVGSEDH